MQYQTFFYAILQVCTPDSCHTLEVRNEYLETCVQEVTDQLNVLGTFSETEHLDLVVNVFPLCAPSMISTTLFEESTQ